VTSQPFAGRIAVLSGATSDIGRAIGLRLASAGAKLRLLGRDRATLESLAEQLRGVCDDVRSFPIDLSVEVTGSYKLQVSTPTDLLSAHGPSGTVTTQVFRITNTGTAPVSNVVMSASAPTDWKVTFSPETTASIAPGAYADITASIIPSGDAIAGDYSLTFTGRGDEANDQADVRFTVEASILGAIVGAALILAAIGGLWSVFRRYGRR